MYHRDVQNGSLRLFNEWSRVLAFLATRGAGEKMSLNNLGLIFVTMSHHCKLSYIIAKAYYCHAFRIGLNLFFFTHQIKMQSLQTNLCRVFSLNPDYCLLRNAIEEVFPHFHKTQLRDALAGGHSRNLDFTASVLRLEAAVLERDKVCCWGFHDFFAVLYKSEMLVL